MNANRYVVRLMIALLLIPVMTVSAQNEAENVLDLVSEDIRNYVIGEYQPIPELQIDEVSIDLLGWYNLVPRAVYEEFRVFYPNIQIEFIDLGVNEVPTRLLTSLSAGIGAPCISMIEDSVIPQFWDAGLIDLTDELAPFEPLFPDYKWNKVVSPEGQIMGVPWEAGPVVLFYRISILEEAGIDVSLLDTWQGFIEAGEMLKEATGGETRMMWSVNSYNVGGTQSNVVDDQFMLSQQLGSGWFDEDGNIILDNEDNIRAMKLLVEMRQRGLTFNDPASGASEIASMVEGRVATFPMAGWWLYYPKANAPETAGDWGIRLIPAWEEGGARGSNVGGTSLYITEQCRHPEHALEFLKFWLLRVDSRITAYKAGAIVENIFLPTTQSEFFQTPDPFFGEGNFFQVTSEAARQAPPIFENPNFNLVSSILERDVLLMLNGEISVEEGLNRVANEARAQIGQPPQPVPNEVPLF